MNKSRENGKVLFNFRVKNFLIESLKENFMADRRLKRSARRKLSGASEIASEGE